MPEQIADRWKTRDEPVLIEIARQLEAGKDGNPHVIAERLGMPKNDVIDSFRKLDGKYIHARFNWGDNQILSAFTNELTERGLRSTGLWPREDAAADALVELLNQAADTTEDEDDAGNLRKAGRLLKSVPGAVIADVTAALIRQQAGI